MHAMAAVMAKEPLLNLADGQAMLLGAAVAEASKHYNFAPNGKVMSIVSLAAAVMIVYVPMAGSIRMKRRAQREQAARSNVSPTPEDAIVREATGTYDFSGLNPQPPN